MKKRCLSLLLAMACLLSLFSFGSLSPVKAQAADVIPDIMLYEDYSSSKEFQISTPNGLQKFSQLGQNTNFSGITFYIVADIDMSGVAYTPIPSFSGTLDGGYHVIERLSITTTNKNCGLFDTVNSSGIVRCLGMEGCVLNATGSSDSHRIGSFAGVLKGLVDQCWSSSVLTMTASGTETDLSAGGIAGALLNGGIVRNSFFAGRITGVDHASGIADWCQGQYEGYVGQIINCFNIGTLNATTCYGLGRYSGKILEANKANAVKTSYYFDNYTDLSWTSEDQKVNKAWLGHGYLAYLMNQNTGSPIWSKGAMFPELRGGSGVYQLKVTYNTKGYTFTSNYYYNAGDTYTVKVPESVSVSLSSPAGSVNGRSYTMPAQNTTLTVTVDLPNVAQFTTYPNESVYVITDKAGFAAMATAVNGGKTFSGKTIYMICDINMDSNAHTPIGQFVSDSNWTKSFSGTFYGNRFRVFNLKVNNTSLNGGGLFGSCYKATFDGLQIFNGSVTTANRAGGITGYADGGCVFRYCSNGADIKTTTGSDGAGGLAGVARGGARFEYCANYGTVTATVKAAAGIAGWGQTNIKLTGCINTGIITAGEDSAALARVGTGYTGTWTETYYLKSACATSVAGSSKDETNFSTGIIGGSINTTSRTKASNNAFTNTPRFPAICMENYAPATCTRLYAHYDGISIGYLTVYGNVGDQVAMTNSQDYYGNPAHTLTAALTSYDYPEAVIYTITYHLNGGAFTQDAPTQYTYVTGAALPLGIQKDGYCFAGWYENSGLTGQVSATVGPNVRGDKTYYAKWSTLVEIGTVAEYLAFVNAVNAGDNYSGKFVRITADLDFGGQTIPALGTVKAPFCGVLDGNGHKLTNFAVTGADNQGLVGYLKQGTIQFLQIENATVSGKISTGTVVGYNDSGLVLGCESSGTVVNSSAIYDLSYMSFNIRCGEDPSPNTVSERTPRVKTYLANYQPDIIGLQEVTPTWKTVLGTALSGYSSEFKYRDSSGKEAAPLYWKTSKFNVMEKGTFWLSPTPDTMSLGWGASINRTCSYAVLQPKNTDIIILAYNTHLDHKSTQAQIEGIKLIKSRIDTMETKYRGKGYSAIYTFVTGDFNAKPTADAGKYLAGTMVESRNNAVSLGTPVNQNTYSAYKETPSQIIDYIYVSRNVDVKTYKVTLDKVNGQAVSDHYGLFGTMRLGGNAQGGIVGTNKGHIQTCGFTGTIESKAGCGGIAGYNGGKIVGSYSKFAPKASDVFVNGIAPKVEGSVFFSYYPSGAGLSGSGSTTGDMTSAAYLPTLNRLHSLWTMSASVNGGLPFICLNHEFTYTDSGNGTHKGVCSYCGTTVTEDHTAVTLDPVAPSCTEDGKTAGIQCALCKAILTPQEAIPATGHSYSAKVTTEATCETPGVRTYTCGNCNHSYTETIEALGHSYTSKVTTTPTCTAEGVTTFTCTHCGHSYTETLPATGHAVVIDQALAPTCLSSGLTEGKHCSVCHAVLVAQNPVPRLGHDPVYADNGDG
ncbi:MAG: InlB B-repeat-containing protein, partial [Oscillospiraceae bacterium]|nr:InlB B-repeat-containing protein [Oscillospiraceae bacterium]